MNKILTLATAAGLAAATATTTATTAGVAGAAGGPETVQFEVTISNVSVAGTLDTDRAGGQVPLSPGVHVVARGSANPLFEVGEPASPGLEDVAEDGVPTVLVAEANAVNRVADVGVLPQPVGPILMGESYTFTVTARPGDRLFLATMFVQSNDYFYANASGIRLFTGNTPVSGDVTSSIGLYDAGTEVDELPGHGDTQVLAQGGAVDVGPDENGVVTSAFDDGFALPAIGDVVNVTVTPVG